MVTITGLGLTGLGLAEVGLGLPAEGTGVKEGLCGDVAGDVAADTGGGGGGHRADWGRYGGGHRGCLRGRGGRRGRWGPGRGGGSHLSRPLARRALLCARGRAGHTGNGRGSACACARTCCCCTARTAGAGCLQGRRWQAGWRPGIRAWAAARRCLWAGTWSSPWAARGASSRGCLRGWARELHSGWWRARDSGGRAWIGWGRTGALRRWALDQGHWRGGCWARADWGPRGRAKTRARAGA